MKRRSLELRQYSDLSRHIKEPQSGIYCLNFFKKDKIWKLRPCFIPKATCCCQFPLCSTILYIFHCVRTWCVVWELHCLSDIATATKEAGFCEGSIGSYRSTTRWNYNCNFVLIYTVYPAHFNISLSLFADPLFPPREQRARRSVTDGTASSTPPSYTHRPIACPPVLRQITDILSH